MQMHGLGKCHGGYELFPFLNDQPGATIALHECIRAGCIFLGDSVRRDALLIMGKVRRLV